MIRKRRSRIDGQTAMRVTSCELVFDAVEILHAVAARPPTLKAEMRAGTSDEIMQAWCRQTGD